MEDLLLPGITDIYQVSFVICDHKSESKTSYQVPGIESMKGDAITVIVPGTVPGMLLFYDYYVT